MCYLANDVLKILAIDDIPDNLTSPGWWVKKALSASLAMK